MFAAEEFLFLTDRYKTLCVNRRQRLEPHPPRKEWQFRKTKTHRIHEGYYGYIFR
jgi:hypothetical protein